ncbi:hypothetical protein TNCT_652191 [Trichonephila clavata]|uniref:Uncharacterized protein n=1 Tax=Trichonephila clavata TaxID=2740835 RepID=A0A8X6EXU0_TRICU|nr:hypothetical protein TNCT_652191 [Trichonephila clavata]
MKSSSQEIVSDLDSLTVGEGPHFEIVFGKGRLSLAADDANSRRVEEGVVVRRLERLFFGMLVHLLSESRVFFERLKNKPVGVRRVQPARFCSFHFLP